MGEKPMERIEEESRNGGGGAAFLCPGSLPWRKIRVKPEQLGEAADKLQIRIVACQLGLFK